MSCREMAQAEPGSQFIVNCASQAGYASQTVCLALLLLLVLCAQPLQQRPHWSCTVVCLQEYFKAINTAKLDYPVYHTHFPGPSVYAKAAR